MGLLWNLIFDDDLFELQVDLCFFSLSLLEFDSVEFGSSRVVVHLIFGHEPDEVFLDEVHPIVDVVLLLLVNVVEHILRKSPPLLISQVLVSNDVFLVNGLVVEIPDAFLLDLKLLQVG